MQLDADADDAIDLEWFVTFIMSPWRFADGSMRGVIVQAVDTTAQVQARRRATQRGSEFRRRYRAALDVIDDLQRTLLPTSLPVLPRLELAARYLVADVEHAAGGDWFDGFVLADHRLAVVVGDVVGHGVAAAGAMSQLRSVLSYLLDSGIAVARGDRPSWTGSPPASREDSPRRSASCWWTRQSGGLSYVTCGHPAPMVVDPAGTARFLPLSGHRPLGAGASADPVTDRLETGEVLVSLQRRPGGAARPHLGIRDGDAGHRRRRRGARPRPGPGCPRLGAGTGLRARRGADGPAADTSTT